MSYKRAIALLTRKPDAKWLEFIYNFKHYDLFVIIDDNTQNYKKLYDVLYPRIKFIQIDNNDCAKNGFYDSSYATNLPRIVSWDKSLYYFSTICLDYDQIWFIEEDVFIYSENVLLELDAEFSEHDILSKNHNIKTDDKVLDWHWKHVYNKISLPWACSLIPICRLSSLLLKKIREYANTNGHLFFIEAMFNTLAEQNNMKIGGKDTGGKMEKFKLIDHMGNSENIVNAKNKMYLFHPIKDVSKHNVIRERLNTSQSNKKTVLNKEVKTKQPIQKLPKENNIETKIENNVYISNEKTITDFNILSYFFCENFITNNSSTIKISVK